MTKEFWVRHLNAVWIMIYCGMITAAFGLQIFDNEQPCPLCYLQRVGMISVCAAVALNLLFGARPIHYGLAFICAIFGGSVALRQILLHICPQFRLFGVPFWGHALYTWSFVSFVCSIFLGSILLCLWDEEQTKPQMNRFQWAAIYWLLLVAAGNVLSTLIECGLAFCKG